MRDAAYNNGVKHSSTWRYAHDMALLAVVVYVLAVMAGPVFVMIDGTGYNGRKYAFIVSVHGSLVSLKGIRGEPYMEG